ELNAMQFRVAADWVVLALTLAAVAALSRRPRASSFEVLLMAAAVYFSFHSQRDTWLVPLVAAALLAGPSRRPAPERERLALTGGRVLAVAVALLLVVVAFAREPGRTEARLGAEVAAEYPEEAAAFVKRQGYKGPLYNDFNWGGYLIWRLPQHP